MKYIILLLLLCPVTQAYYVGYTVYGLNHTTSSRILENVSQYLEVDSIIFSNSTCVSRYGGYCNVANFEFWYSGRTRITVSMLNANYEDMLFYIYHEIKHHHQYLNQPFRVGFTDEEEEEADEYAGVMVCGS